MKQQQVLCGLALLLLSACSSNKDGNNIQGNINMEQAISNAEKRSGADPNTSGGNTCLLDYASRYDQLLTTEMVLLATGFSDATMKTKYQKLMKNNAYHEVTYSFKNGRQGSITGLKGIYTIPDVIALSSIKAMSLQQFNDSYRALTDEEEEAVEEAKKEVLSGKSGDKDADKALDKLKREGLSEEQTRKTTNVLTNAFKEVAKAWQVLEGLGQAARWNTRTQELVILQNGVQFALRIDISNDSARNKSVAMGLAKEILAKCP